MINWPWSMTSTSPSTSSQQLVWSCSPFFTNSMISQLHVPSVNVIITLKIIDHGNTCIVELAGFEDKRQLFCFVHSADPTVRWEVECSPVFQPPALLTNFWHIFGHWRKLLFLKRLFNYEWSDHAILDTWCKFVMIRNVAWFLQGMELSCSCGRSVWKYWVIKVDYISAKLIMSHYHKV